MRDKYNLNTLPASLAGFDDYDIDEHIVIPGMGPEDKVDLTDGLSSDYSNGIIPGLDLDTSSLNDRRDREKKVPYSKPIPRNFQAHWNEPQKIEEAPPPKQMPVPHQQSQNYNNSNGNLANSQFEDEEISAASLLAVAREAFEKIIKSLPGTIPLNQLKPDAITIYGKELKVQREYISIFAILIGNLLIFFF